MILVTICNMWGDEARERLRGAGHRVGAAGGAVIDYLDSGRCCVGAQDIHTGLRGRVGLASVYRTVERLAALDLVSRVDLGDGIVRYEPARDADHHHHLVCGTCGKVEPFADTGLEHAIHALESERGFTVSAHEVVLRGSCSDCR